MFNDGHGGVGGSGSDGGVIGCGSDDEVGGSGGDDGVIGCGSDGDGAFEDGVYNDNSSSAVLLQSRY